MRNGIDAWPGVPFTRSAHHWLPFSATITGSFTPVGDGIGMPPDSVMTKSQSIASRSFFVSQSAPYVPSASSSATAR